MQSQNQIRSQYLAGAIMQAICVVTVWKIDRLLQLGMQLIF